MKIVRLSQVPKWKDKNPTAAEFLSALRSESYLKEFMVSLVNNYAKGKMWDGTIDLNTDDIRSALLMTNTTADTEGNVQLMNAYTTLDECDATGYARVALVAEAVNIDTVNNRAEFDANDLSFTGLGGNATRAIQGVLLYKHITNDTDSLPIVFIDFTSDIPTTATQIDVPFDAQGILQAA
ncbi:hypothetical protein Pan258_02120 [Symmachiella dynata]|uniref:hypothetical protein n=1 Tax=Symmachiella dynata TaxID=2527995 RepID=UPI00118B088B|nr:hypothetical protein [Symmachiella dynata]QDT46195.1 hypothetical protein Pan258_02120 [Symmachiella dynata]